MKYDYFALLKKEKFQRETYDKLRMDDNMYFIHAKRDKIFRNKAGDSHSWYFGNKRKEYSLSEDFISESDISEGTFSKIFFFSLKLTSPFFTASEDKFYSIRNPIVKDKPTEIPVLKGISLKGALRQAAVDDLENELIKESCLDKNYNGILKMQEDKFSFKKRAQLVKLFGNEKDITWFTFKSLLATGGIKDVAKIKEVLDKISSAFKHYLRKNKITDEDGNCKGRIIFENLYFKKVVLDVITPLNRKRRTPIRGPIYYEVVPPGETATGKIIWFPFDLVVKGVSKEKINKEWNADKKIIKGAFERLSEKGIGAKTKDGWGRFEWEEI